MNSHWLCPCFLDSCCLSMDELPFPVLAFIVYNVAEKANVIQSKCMFLACPSSTIKSWSLCLTFMSLAKGCQQSTEYEMPVGGSEWGVGTF